MVTTALQGERTTEPPDSASPESDFDPVVSRDLEQLAVADCLLRQIWEALEPVAHRSVVATGCVLEVVAMQSDLLAERRRLERRVGL